MALLVLKSEQKQRSIVHHRCSGFPENTLIFEFCNQLIYLLIHSGHFYSAPLSPLLLRGAPDCSTDTVSEFHAEAHRQLQVKDLPKVPTWRLERERTHDPPVESYRLNQGATTSH